MLRKIVIAVVLVYFKDPFIQSFAATFVLSLALYAQIEFKPYQKAILNRVEELGLTTTLFTQMLCLSYFWIDNGMDEAPAQKLWKVNTVTLLLMWINLDAAMMFATYMWTASKDDAKAFARRIGRKLCGSERWCLPQKVPKKMRLSFPTPGEAVKRAGSSHATAANYTTARRTPPVRELLVEAPKHRRFRCLHDCKH